MPAALAAAVLIAHAVCAPWRGGNTVDPRPLEPSEAAELLARAEDREAIFAALVRAARARAPYAAILVVQGGIAYGRVAIDDLEPDSVHVAQVTVPLERGSAFRQVVESRAPYIGPVATGVAEMEPREG